MLFLFDTGMWALAILFVCFGVFCNSRKKHWILRSEQNKGYKLGDRAMEKAIIWDMRIYITLLGMATTFMGMGIMFLGFFGVIFTALLYIGLRVYLINWQFFPNWNTLKKSLVEVQYKIYQDQQA
jgi:hypothetical protein